MWSDKVQNVFKISWSDGDLSNTFGMSWGFGVVGWSEEAWRLRDGLVCGSWECGVGNVN